MAIFGWSLTRSNSYGDTNENPGWFFPGNREHNVEILQNLDDDSIIDEADEDRLIYEATKKLLQSPRDSERRQVVVESAELDGKDSNKEGDNSSDFDISENVGDPDATRTRIKAYGRRMFRIFKNDDSYIEVTREEIRRVRAIHKRFREGSEFCFNYNVLLIIASIIAALGLGSNSSASVIASMLVSPLMGPVLGMAYGATILDMKLFWFAFRTEMLSLLTCILVGAVVGAIMIPCLSLPSTPLYDVPELVWPTSEMDSRATIQNLIIGIPIAFFSGLGVTVSALDEQTSSLVGVAISASLLPPAINAGMLWITLAFQDAGVNQDHILWREGLISLCLTLINIVLIIFASMLMFRYKERMHIKNKKIFWSDLGLARKIYRNLAVHDDSDRDGPMRRMGRRVSYFVSKAHGSSTSNLIHGSTAYSHKSENNDGSSKSYTNSPRFVFKKKSQGIPQSMEKKLTIPQGSEDLSSADPSARKNLSIVLEERQSGNSGNKSIP